MNKQKTALRKTADSLFSKVILARDRYCLICGLFAYDAHHIIPRSLSEYLRYDTLNGVGLCRNDHIKIEDRNPFTLEILSKKLGEERINYLTMRRRDMVVLNVSYLEESIERLTRELKRNISH